MLVHAEPANGRPGFPITVDAGFGRGCLKRDDFVATQPLTGLHRRLVRVFRWPGGQAKALNGADLF
jgi:hypothetical protein